MLKNLMDVTIYVNDQDRALAFYTEALWTGEAHRLPRS
jgi:hypothetical protein